ncbi:Serine/threonine-protein kinase CBK1 [Vanrija pseudolonga]|uniref:non-specific serine/threonine protein kinase n=1 Tax=Vanrija pseudolonga TaxID=143232 RepID=A0AAF1BGG2_9TREE|nr:Serine/threonine-protein kinase CBK1 [Vanrija pseudolonga]
MERPWSRWASIFGMVLPRRGQNGEPRTLFGFIDSRRPSVYPDHLVTEAEGVSRPVVAVPRSPVVEGEERNGEPSTAAAEAGPSSLPDTATTPSVTLDAAALAAAGDDEYPNGTVRTVKRPRVINKLSLDLALVPPQTPPSSTPNSPSPPTASHGSPSRASSRTLTAPRPALETLERASCAALYFEQYYHNLTKPDAKRQLLRRDTVDITHFDIGRVIGQGAFGVVRIAAEASRPDHRLVAIKQLRKSDLLKMGQEGHIRAERDLLTSAADGALDTRPSWILRLFHAFQDKDSLYLVLDFMGGGDLLTLLMERISLPEAVVRFYAAEMILALQQVHALGYIHRDVKPDNFLFTSEGHIRIADFGLATDLHWSHDSAYYEQQRRTILKKHGFDLSKPAFGNRKRRTGRDQTGGSGVGSLREKSRSILGLKAKSRRRLAYTICGTNSYMAPEVIRGQGYGFGVDWWSLGVILYEAMFGAAPFIGNSRHEARVKILEWKDNLKFPRRPHVSHFGIDFIRQLLCEPEERLGSPTSVRGKNPVTGVSDQRASHIAEVLHPINPATLLAPDGAEQLMSHPLQDKTPPYQPNLSTPDDTRHFDEDIPDEPLAPANSALQIRDPLLGDGKSGPHLLEIRKGLAFRGWTFREPSPFAAMGGDTEPTPRATSFPNVSDDSRFLGSQSPASDSSSMMVVAHSGGGGGAERLVSGGSGSGSTASCTTVTTATSEGGSKGSEEEDDDDEEQVGDEDEEDDEDADGGNVLTPRGPGAYPGHPAHIASCPAQLEVTVR